MMIEEYYKNRHIRNLRGGEFLPTEELLDKQEEIVLTQEILGIAREELGRAFVHGGRTVLSVGAISRMSAIIGEVEKLNRQIEDEWEQFVGMIETPAPNPEFFKQYIKGASE